MAEFISWADELRKFKNAMASRSIDSYFVAEQERPNSVRTMYTKLGNIQSFLEWLEGKAAEEALGSGISGGMFTSIGGN